VKGCAQKGLDINEGGAELGYVTIEAVTYATTVDSLLAVKYLVFDQKACTMAELIQALKDNWSGHEILQARALHKAPKYGRDDDVADAMAYQVMQLWTEETWRYRTKSTGRNIAQDAIGIRWQIPFIWRCSDGPQRKISPMRCALRSADINDPPINSVGSRWQSPGGGIGGITCRSTGAYDDLPTRPSCATRTGKFQAIRGCWKMAVRPCR
jgi:formate C-acetyltransferase